MNDMMMQIGAAVAILVAGIGPAQSQEVTIEQGRDLPVTVRAFVGSRGALDERVDVDIRDQSVRDALASVLEQTKTVYTLDDDVPTDVRITVVARGVRLRSVLDLIADAAGIGWLRELGSGKARLRFGKSIRSWIGSRMGFDLGLPQRLEGLQEMLVEPLKDGVLWRAYIGNEERSSITCPHCKASITRVTKRSTDKCTKCNVEFKPGWKVCPFDGTKRPEPSGDWKFCPVCGKTLGATR